MSARLITSRPARRAPPFSSGALRAVLVGTTYLLSAGPSCSHDSYLKVTLLAADGTFQDVGRVDVSVQSGTNMSSAWLQYVPGTPISFDTMTSRTLSISFTPSQSGAVFLDVGVVDSGGACLGRGSATTSIKKGEVSSVLVTLRHTTTCPAAMDGGTADTGRSAITFPGCDPARPTDTCAANQTCFVNCKDRLGMCVAAGTKGPGEICMQNDDCMPGTQCFDYSTLPGCGSGTKVCQKFCSDDAQCASGSGGRGSGGVGGDLGTGGSGGHVDAGAGERGGGGGGGGGTGPGGAGVLDPAVPGISTCRNPVICSPNVLTTYSTCGFACDPRGDATLGCPTGLLCFLYKSSAPGGEDGPDCGCREPTRTGTDGTSCTSSTTCAPGHICNVMGSTQVCRKLCRMSALTDCAAPKTCNALLNNSVFGVCVPPA